MKLLILALCSFQLYAIDKLYTTSQATLYSCAALDLVSTNRAISKGYVEANPIMRRNPYLVKGIVLGGLWILHKTTSNRKLKTTSNFVVGGVWCGASGWNFKLK